MRTLLGAVKDATYNPAWAPDGRTIAVGAGVIGPLLVVGADGRGLRQLTNPRITEGDRFPAWSPNSKKIVFVRTGAFSSEVMVANRDGSGARKVVAIENNPQADLIRPAWSTDGSSIVYADVDDGDRLRGRRLAPAPGPGHYDQPAIAPK